MNIIKRIWDWIVSVPKDKLLHFIFGLLAMLFGCALFSLFCPNWIALIAGNALGLLVLILKEVYDWRNQEEHTVEFMDIIAGVVGMLIADIPLALIMFL